MNLPKTQSDAETGNHWWTAMFVVPAVYWLSSGPVLGLAFWLRESTGWDGWYGALFLYWPVLGPSPESLMGRYIEWWVVEVFHTVGPG